MAKIANGYYLHEVKKNKEYLFNEWARSREKELYDSYANPSQAKWEAWHNCKRICAAFGGSDLRVTGHNCFTFSAAFVITDSETGEIKEVVKITPYNLYFVTLTD